MPTVFPRNYLPEPAQPWAREVQKQLANVIASNRANEINNATRDNQLNSSLISLTSVVADVKTAAQEANDAINGLIGLGSAGSEYTLNASNITAGTITGSTVQTSTTTGVSLNNATNSISFRVGTTTVGHILPLSTFGILMHYGETPDPNGTTTPQIFVGSSSISLIAESLDALGVSNNGVAATRFFTKSISVGLNAQNVNVATGNVFIEDNVSAASGTFNSVNGGDGTFNSSLRSSNIPSFGVGAAGFSVFATSNAGRLGFSTSSLKTKQEIELVDIDVSKILQVTPKSFKYNVDVEEYGLENAETTVGFIAEDLNDLGLNYFVRYNDAGEPIAIPYEKYVVALQAVVRNLNDRITTLENGAN